MSLGQAVYACKCINVILSAGKSELIGTKETVEADTQLSNGVVPTVQIALPLLTTRVSLSPSGVRKESLVGLRCLNCSTVVYAIEDPDQAQSGRSSVNSRSVGFAAARTPQVDQVTQSSSSNKDHGHSYATASPQRSGSVPIGQIEKGDENGSILPVHTASVIWILKGCLSGEASISAVKASPLYSPIFKIVIQSSSQDLFDGEGKESSAVEEPKRQSTNRQLADRDADLSQIRSGRRRSPRRDYSFLSSPQKRTSASPSPARRRRAIAEEEEEEQGEDLDTLHLLETLLPHLPSSIVRSATGINGEGISANLRRTTPTKTSSLRSSESPVSSTRKLEAKLDSQALAVLRAKREEAQRAVYEILKQKTAELVKFEDRLRQDARQLREAAAHHGELESQQQQRALQLSGVRALSQNDSLSTGALDDEHQALVAAEVEGGDGGSPLFIRRRPLVPAMERTSSQDSESTRKVSAGAVGVPGTSNRSQGAVVGSYLSASFAMRGRDLPHKEQKEEGLSKEDEEDWFAHKKRLRERYPHADHSALPSAVNSDDEDAVQVKEQVEGSTASINEEEERRGRERGRKQGHNRDQTPSNKTPTPPRKRDSEGRKEGLARQSSNGPNEELSQSAKTMRGALKGGLTTSEKSSTHTSEKKVAFASTTEEHEVASSHVDDDDGQTKAHDLDAGDPLFEIDEDIERDDSTPNSSNIILDDRSAALQQAGEELVQEDLREDERASLLDEDLERTESIAHSLPVAGSFSAMAESESRRLMARHLVARELDTNDEFDPASLRFDGRAVYASGEMLATGSLTQGMPAKDRSLEASKDSSRSLSQLNHERAVRDAQQALSAGFPTERIQRSAIGFRVAVGEAEARLSGLLAPHAPSHRNLYSSRRKVDGPQKYALPGLGEEDEEKVTETDTYEEEASKPKQSNAKTLKDSTSKHLKKRDGLSKEEKSEEIDPALLARSVPIRGALMARGSSSTIHRDRTSGFDLEPKTSLPYQERHLTPSLRKAMRSVGKSGEDDGLRPVHKSSLGAISDVSENGSSSAEARDGDQIVVPGRPPSSSREHSASSIVPGVKPIGIANAAASSATATGSPRLDLKYSLPGSVTRGFDVGGSWQRERATVPARSLAAAAMAASAQSSPMLGSSADTGRSSSRIRSPRPPYVQPPPPSTTEMRLKPDAQHQPAPLSLAPMTEPDEYEEDEEEQDIDDTLQFMHTAENLKTSKRTGWYHHRIEQPESIADHMFRMGILSMLLPDTSLDLGKCVQLCLVHDLAESLVGDLTPLDNVPREEKHRREQEAIAHLVHGQLHGSKAALRIEALWNEYEARQTPESKAVKDLDRFELSLQAVEYERRFKTADLQPFYNGSSDQIRHPRIQRWIRRLAKEREALWSDTEFAYTQSLPDDKIPPPPWARS